jgi:HEAT repeat protein
MGVLTQFAFGALLIALLGLTAAAAALIALRSRDARRTTHRNAIRQECRRTVAACAEAIRLAPPGDAVRSETMRAAQKLTPNGADESAALKEIIVESYGVAATDDERRGLAELYEATGMMAHDTRTLYEGNSEERAHAAYRLGRLRCRSAIEALTAVTRASSGDLRLVATWALTETGDARAVQPIIASLADADGWRLMQAANCLLGMNVDLTLPLLELLGAAGAQRERRERTAAAILDLISDFGQRARSQLNLHACRHAAGDLIRSGSVDIRTRALRALASLGVETSQDVERIVRALRDEAWEVRAVAARALGDLGLSSAVPQLCQAVSDPAWWVRYNAAHALQRLGEEGGEALRKLQLSEDRFAREIAFQALSQEGSDTQSLLSGFR